MRNLYKRILATTFTSILISSASMAQNFDVLFNFDKADATQYLREYSKPTVLAFSNGLSGGWYNTAKPHKLLGFDLTVTMNAVAIPSSDEVFDFNAFSWNNLSLTAGSDSNLPTLTGGSTDAQLQIDGNGSINGFPVSGSTTFDAPDGADINIVGGIPVPTIQLGIGIVKNTDLKLRYIPEVSYSDAKFSQFGVGIMHDIKQWIPGIKALPFSLSALVGYNQMDLSYEVSEEGNDFSANGQVNFTSSSTTVQAIISKKVAVLTPYVGVGYNIVSSSLEMSDLVVREKNTGSEVEFEDIDFDGGSSPRLTAGLRLKLAIIAFHAEYTVQKYSMFSVGAGINVR